MGSIPNAKVPLLNGDGSLTLPWRLFMQNLGSGSGSVTPAELAALEAAVATAAAEAATAQTAATQALANALTALGQAQAALAIAALNLDQTTGSTFSLDSIGSTQGDTLYRGASAWQALAPGTAGQVLTTGGAGANPSWNAAGGGFAPVVKVTSGSATSVTFSGTDIPSSGYDNLILEMCARSAGSNNETDVLAAFNGDTTAGHYNYQIIEAVNSNISTPNTYAGTNPGLFIGNIPGGSTVEAGAAGTSTTRIYQYLSSLFHKNAITSSMANLIGYNNLDNVSTVGTWNAASPVPVTSLTITLGDGSAFVNGSVFILRAEV